MIPANPDPGRFFLDGQGPTPLYVEHATGRPVYAVVEGRLVDFEPWHRRKPPSLEPARAFSIASTDGAFRAGIEVSS
jgi:hypothetical protein